MNKLMIAAGVIGFILWILVMTAIVKIAWSCIFGALCG